MKNTTAATMTDKEARDTIRQMLKDWNAATDEQRAEALRKAEEGAARKMAAGR